MNLQAMLLREEGREHAAYPDPLTHGDPYTIGIGHTGPEVHAGLIWDDFQIDAAFQLDVETSDQGCEANFEPWLRSLPGDPPTLVGDQTEMHPANARQAVLLAMVFQMGIGRLSKFVDTLAAIRDQRFAHAAESMRQSVWAHQTPLRANRMASQIETGAWQ